MHSDSKKCLCKKKKTQPSNDGKSSLTAVPVHIVQFANSSHCFVAWNSLKCYYKLFIMVIVLLVLVLKLQVSCVCQLRWCPPVVRSESWQGDSVCSLWSGVTDSYSRSNVWRMEFCVHFMFTRLRLVRLAAEVNPVKV